MCVYGGMGGESYGSAAPLSHPGILLQIIFSDSEKAILIVQPNDFIKLVMKHLKMFSL